MRQVVALAGTTHYVYDLAGHLIAEASDTGATVREYVWLDDTPLAVVADVDTASPSLYFVHADRLNRPFMMTDGAKNVVWSATYWPFGEVASITGSASNNLRFPGQYFQIESGLHYNWYRHYDPTRGRYTQPDPFGFVDGPSVYAYAAGNPASFTVRTGLEIFPNSFTGPLLQGDIWQSQVAQFPDAHVYTSNGRQFLAPKGTDWCAVQSAGRSEGYVGILSNITQGGKYDFQRSSGRYRSEYIDASNYSVGIYINGVGSSRITMHIMGRIYAFAKSSNSGSPKQCVWWDNGWGDADRNSLGGCSCQAGN
jgi:RHS repeat-associated protein